MVETKSADYQNGLKDGKRLMWSVAQRHYDQMVHALKENYEREIRRLEYLLKRQSLPPIERIRLND